MICSYIYYTWRDIILIFKLHRRTRLAHRSSIHCLKIRMTSHPCNKYEHTTLSHPLSVNYCYETFSVPNWINNGFLDFNKIENCPYMREGEGSILGTFETKTF